MSRPQSLSRRRPRRIVAGSRLLGRELRREGSRPRNFAGSADQPQQPHRHRSLHTREHPPGVNFINIFSCLFCNYKSVLEAFYLITVWLL